MSEHLSFKLSEEFISGYAERQVDWGFPIGGGNSLGEMTFISKYSRRKEDGTKEKWYECCRRVVEGTYSILKNHCMQNRTPWNHAKAHRAAEDMFERLFSFKWTPPGRGLWMMGTEFVMEHGSAALQNCSFLSTEALGPRNPTGPFVRLMEMSMLGVGVGFDTKGAGKLTLWEPEPEHFREYLVEDSREGWCESTNLVLRSYLAPHQPTVILDYSAVRPAGAPIKGFGGVAAGPGPLIQLHETLRTILGGRWGDEITSTDIVDIMNLIGKCVVSGNVRRSAEIALGDPDDKAFLQLKDWNVNPARMGVAGYSEDGSTIWDPSGGWGGLSNNSVITKVGGNYDHLIEGIAVNGEPGLVYLDLARSHGRLVDPANNRDHRAMGVNPCAEQTLEDQECCTLVETYPVRCDDKADFLRTLKVAYLYAKAVTLLPTHWPETNEVMQRNRRIGTSISGIVQFLNDRSWTEMKEWYEDGYAEVTSRDVQYSEWLGVRESIKTTSVKPSGTVSRLMGCTPGVHFPVETNEFFRRDRHAAVDPIVGLLAEAGYHVEPDVQDPETTVVVTFPVSGPQVRSEHEATVWEKVAIAAQAQRYWADNQVSATFTFSAAEKDQLGAVIHAYDGQLKSLSFLPIYEAGGAYTQMPFERVSEEEWAAAREGIRPFNYQALYDGLGEDAEGERYCSNDTCELPPLAP